MRNFCVPDQSHETKKDLIFRDLGFDAFNSQHKQVVKLFFNIFGGDYLESYNCGNN
jgi:hypothetical protein